MRTSSTVTVSLNASDAASSAWLRSNEPPQPLLELVASPAFVAGREPGQPQPQLGGARLGQAAQQVELGGGPLPRHRRRSRTAPPGRCPSRRSTASRRRPPRPARRRPDCPGAGDARGRPTRSAARSRSRRAGSASAPRGADREVAHGSGNPAIPGNTCRSGPTSDTRAIGTPSQRRTRSATACICSSATAVSPDSARACTRAGSLSRAHRTASAAGWSDPAVTT